MCLIEYVNADLINCEFLLCEWRWLFGPYPRLYGEVDFQRSKNKKQCCYIGTTFEFIWSQNSINPIKSSSSMLITMYKNTFTTAMTMLHYLERIFFVYIALLIERGVKTTPTFTQSMLHHLVCFKMYVMILVMQTSKNCKPIMLVQTLFIWHECPNKLNIGHII